MGIPRSVDFLPAHPLLGRVGHALATLEVSSRLAVAGILIGWFFIDYLVVSLGSLHHGVRFFDMSAMIADPVRLFLGVDSSMQPLLFSFLCLACLAAPLTVPQLIKNRFAWLAYLAPLALIVLCAALLYSRTSAEFFADDSARHGGGLAAQHVSLGAGGYLALIGSLFLGIRGVRRFHLAAR
jgi:Fe2+ transport system protein B